MAILSDKTIKEYMDGGKLVIDPILDEKQIQPSSIDMRLGKEFKVFNYTWSQLLLKMEKRL